MIVEIYVAKYLYILIVVISSWFYAIFGYIDTLFILLYIFGVYKIKIETNGVIRNSL